MEEIDKTVFRSNTPKNKMFRTYLVCNASAKCQCWSWETGDVISYNARGQNSLPSNIDLYID